MTDIQSEIAAFQRAKEQQSADARKRLALQLYLNVDLSELDLADSNKRKERLLKTRRLLERERLRGTRRHWSYDLNRHIALKEACDYLDPQRKIDSQTVVRRRRIRPAA